MIGNEKVVLMQGTLCSPPDSHVGSINLPSECSQLTAQSKIRI